MVARFGEPIARFGEPLGKARGGGGGVAAPVITSPADNAIVDDSTPDIVISAVSGATGYDFQIATDSAFSSIVASVTDHASTTWTADALTYAADHYVRVRTKVGAVASAWSETIHFRLSYRLKLLSKSFSEVWGLSETSGLVALAQMDTDRNGTYSGATLNALTFLDGTPAPTFDGINDQVDLLTASLQGVWDTAQGTLTCWIYDTDATASTLRAALSFGDTDAAQVSRLYKQTTHRLDVFKTADREAAVARVTGQWRQLALSWNNTGNIVRCVADGVAASPSAGTISGAGNLNHAYAGRRIDGRFWLGGLKWVCYKNTVMSEADLIDLFTVPQP